MENTKTLEAANLLLEDYAEQYVEQGGWTREQNLEAAHIVQTAIDEATADLRAQLATEKARADAAEKALEVLVEGVGWLIPYAKVQLRYVFAPDFQGWCKFVAAYESSSEQPTENH